MRTFIRNLESKGLNKDNAYRFINGHTLEDKIVLPFIRSVHKKRKEYESDTIPNYGNSQQTSRIAQIHKHFNEKCDIKTLMSSHIEKILDINDPISGKILDKANTLNLN